MSIISRKRVNMYKILNVNEERCFKFSQEKNTIRERVWTWIANFSKSNKFLKRILVADNNSFVLGVAIKTK